MSPPGQTTMRPIGHKPVKAAILMLVSVLLFSLMDAGLKTLSAHYPPFQVATLRGAASLRRCTCCVACWAWR
jgi:hypothetical protein